MDVHPQSEVLDVNAFEHGNFSVGLTGTFAANLGVQPEARANRSERPVVSRIVQPMISTVSTSTRTLQLRIKDKHAKVPRQMVREVNQVWNHINEVSAKAVQPFHGKPKCLSSYDLQKFGHAPDMGYRWGFITRSRVLQFQETPSGAQPSHS